MAAAVATLEPDTAENRPQAAMLEWSRPPGMSWNQRERPRYSRPLNPVRRMISPMKMKSGIAVSTKL